MSENNQNKWYYKILSLLKLETTSKHGRVNLAGVIVITIFCLIYTAGDGIGFFLSSVSDVIKSIVLKQDVFHQYESTSVVEAVIPILIAFLLCLLFLAWHESKKKK